MSTIDPKGICQVALVVKDIEKAAKNYAEIFGVEVPKIFYAQPADEPNIMYRGKLTSTKTKLCVFDLGSLVLELTEPDDQPSSWKEFLDAKGEGVHHIGFTIDDREKTLNTLEDRGIDVRLEGTYPGGGYIFVESEEQLGVLLNLKYKR